jgi:hypothetical protein
MIRSFSLERLSRLRAVGGVTRAPRCRRVPALTRRKAAYDPSMRRNERTLVGGLLVALLSACGADDQSTIVSFGSSACKKETVNASRMAHIRSLLVIDNEAGLEGLRCVAWQRTSTGVRLDLYNFDGACGATWTGDGALAADGTLDLHVDNPSCIIAKCGSCLYDWSFTLNTPLPSGAAVPLVVSVDACAATQAATFVSSTLGPAESGITCTLADYGALNSQADAAGTCGQAGMPCVGSLLCGSGSFASTGDCDDGLVCDSSAAPNEPVCLVPCTTDADCPRQDVYTCTTGLCRPKG